MQKENDAGGTVVTLRQYAARAGLSLSAARLRAYRALKAAGTGEATLRDGCKVFRAAGPHTTILVRMPDE